MRATQLVQVFAEVLGVTVEVRDEGGLIRLMVADDGIGGADPHALGLRALSDRVAVVGGRLSVTSSPLNGTRVTAEIPLTRQALGE
ncbi:hypothetical protein [Streptosporangium sp. NBC_01469]|uniref:hypothetical protein n=1 Tax=Streptosporangium sp. NBC_01469 TaxID=2903898 RepID=UPI002E2B8E38|nr:hypothetical protein [Streptosporangium sp. NBC_01469]